MKAPWTRLAAPLAGEQAAEVVPEAREGWEAVWVCQWPGGESAHGSEKQAELAAREVVASKRAVQVVVFRVVVEAQGEAA